MTMVLLTWVVVDVLGLTVASLLDLHHLHLGRGRCGHIDWDKLDWNILGHLNHIGLLGDGHLDLDHLGWPGVVVVVVLVLVVVVGWQLDIHCLVVRGLGCLVGVVLRLERVEGTRLRGAIAIQVSLSKSKEREGKDLGLG